MKPTLSDECRKARAVLDGHCSPLELRMVQTILGMAADQLESWEKLTGKIKDIRRNQENHDEAIVNGGGT